MVDAENRRFNFIQNNCTSTALMMIKESLLEDDSINFVWPEVARDCINAPGVAYITRESPWMQFVCLALLGTEGEKTWPNIQRMSPELVIPLLQASSFVNGSESRPVLTGEHKSLLNQTVIAEECWLSPALLFSLVLVAVLLVSIAERKRKLKQVVRIMDVAMLVLQTFLGVLLCFITFQAGLFGVHWNWFLVPFNPLPLVVWLVWRKRGGWNRIYLAYAVVLTAFIAGAASLSVFYLEHGLLVGIFAARCWTKALLHNKRTI